MVPPTVLPKAPSMRMPSFALPRSAVAGLVLSVPIRLPSIRFWVEVDQSISIPDEVPRSPEHPGCPHLGLLIFQRPFNDLDAVFGVAEVGGAVRIRTDQVVADDDPGGRGARNQDADQIGGDDVAGADQRARRIVRDAGLDVGAEGVAEPAAVRPMMSFLDRISGGHRCL